MSIGSVKLKEYINKMKKKKKTQNDLAVLLECSRSYLSELANGKKIPSIEFATRIEKVAKVKVTDWSKGVLNDS